jgi:hypothetical protein
MDDKEKSEFWIKSAEENLDIAKDMLLHKHYFFVDLCVT